MVWASLQPLGPHQLTEMSHYLTFNIPTLIKQDLYGQPIVNSKLVPKGFGDGLGSLGLGNKGLGILSEVVCYH